MSAQKNLFKGAWAVIAQEYRRRGEWQCEYEFTHDDWSVGFLENGFYGEIFRPEREIRNGRWVCDQRGIISIDHDPENSRFLTRCVYEGTEAGGWLYFYDDDSTVPLDRNIIIAHHANERWKLISLIADQFKIEN
jgi:hypothetical protein